MTAGNMETLSTKGEGIVDHSEDKQRLPSNETVATAGSLSHHNHSTTHQTNTYDSNASEHGSSVLLAAPKCTTTENTQSLSTKTWTKDITTNKVVPANNKVKKKKTNSAPPSEYLRHKNIPFRNTFHVSILPVSYNTLVQCIYWRLLQIRDVCLFSYMYFTNTFISCRCFFFFKCAIYCARAAYVVFFAQKDL